MKRWTDEEDAVLLSLYPVGGSSAVKERTGRSELAIRLRAQRLGVTVAQEFLGANIKTGIAKTDRHGTNNANWKGGISKGGWYRYNKKTRKKHYDKHLARSKCERAVQAGRIKKEPCGVCGNPKSEAHHRDYSKPLEVVWLCRKHHIEQHKKESC